MNAPEFSDNHGHLRRKYPRREIKRLIGVLCGGSYIVAQTTELGEGGMSLLSDYVLEVGQRVVISFHIPGGDFISIRAEIKAVNKKNSDGLVNHGVQFEQIEFKHKRQIRAFVSSREI